MKELELLDISEALLRLSVHLDCSVNEIIDLLSGVLISEEDAGELNRYFSFSQE